MLQLRRLPGAADERAVAEEGEKGTRFYTLNGSGLAVGRTLIAVLVPASRRFGRGAGRTAAVHGRAGGHRARCRPRRLTCRTRVLISNDDGIRAPGLKVLEKVMRRLAREVWVVAPDTEQSAASHSLTMRRPLYLRQVGRRRFTVDGTPTDCVLIAIHQVLKDRPPDLVLSGINRGGNLGEDATYSGTVAAAMEGTLLGIRSMALSQVMKTAPTRRGRRRRPGRWRCCAGCPASSGRGGAAQRQFPAVPSDR